MMYISHSAMEASDIITPLTHVAFVGARLFATLGNSVVPPLQPATPVLSALNELKININLC